MAICNNSILAQFIITLSRTDLVSSSHTFVNYGQTSAHQMADSDVRSVSISTFFEKEHRFVHAHELTGHQVYVSVYIQIFDLFGSLLFSLNRRRWCNKLFQRFIHCNIKRCVLIQFTMLMFTLVFDLNGVDLYAIICVVLVAYNRFCKMRATWLDCSCHMPSNDLRALIFCINKRRKRKKETQNRFFQSICSPFVFFSFCAVVWKQHHTVSNSFFETKKTHRKSFCSSISQSKCKY